MNKNTAVRTPKSPSEIDIAVSNRLRRLRHRAGMTLQDLAGKIGISFQQTHKYEIGASRISAGMLVKMADALGAEIMEFFQDRDTDAASDKTEAGKIHHKLSLAVERQN